jgi:C2H2-type zinc finger
MCRVWRCCSSPKPINSHQNLALLKNERCFVVMNIQSSKQQLTGTSVGILGSWIRKRMKGCFQMLNHWPQTFYSILWLSTTKVDWVKVDAVKLVCVALMILGVGICRLVYNGLVLFHCATTTASAFVCAPSWIFMSGLEFVNISGCFCSTDVHIWLSSAFILLLCQVNESQRVFKEAYSFLCVCVCVISLIYPRTFLSFQTVVCKKRCRFDWQVYKCVLKACNESFRELEAFLEHIRQHENQLSYRCHQCNKQFSSLDELGKHQYTHSLFPNQGPKPGPKWVH